MRDPLPATIYRSDYQQPQWRIDATHLSFKLSPQHTEVCARLQLTSLAGATDPTLVGEQLEFVSLKIDGQAAQVAQYAVTEAGLHIVDLPATCTLEITNRIAPADNTALEGLYISSGVFCTQCEPEGFRRITYFLDRPDVLSTYTVRLQADAALYPVLLSNGNLMEQGLLDNGEHYAVWHDPFPKPSYLFAIVAGNLTALKDSLTTMSGRSVGLEIWSTPQNLPRAEFAMNALKASIRWDETRFAREYDLDRFMIFVADDFNMGAMENKGLNIFNSKLVLADPASATDDDYARIEAVIGHEYFHNWTGNRITCRDWFQLSLKEGLTVFREQEFAADMRTRDAVRIESVQFLRVHQFAEDASAMAHPVRPDSFVEINNFYTATVYEKGSEVIRMMHTLLGEAAFQRGIQLYFKRHDGQAVTCDDFVQAMQDASQVDLSQFALWYSEAGTPRLAITTHYDEAAKTYTVDVTQSRPMKAGHTDQPPLQMPWAMGLMDSRGNPIPLRQPDRDAYAVLVLKQTQQRFIFSDIPEHPTPSFNLGFAAPVLIEYDYSLVELGRLANFAPDTFVRWDATQTLLQRSLHSLIADEEGAAELRATESVIQFWLQDKTADPALVAAALKLPDFAEIVGALAVIDVQKIDHALKRLREHLAHTLYAHWLTAYQAHNHPEHFAPTAAQAARRALKNLCLQYLVAGGDDAALAIAETHYANADNMTDSLGALNAINHTDTALRPRLMQDFFERWQHDALTLDKWLGLQATRDHPKALTTVIEIFQSTHFDQRNPNRLRALIGSFALRNWPRFHATDGSGYAFLQTVLLDLDARNPQVAARMVQAFSRWKKFSEPGQSAQRQVLQTILAKPGLSGDLFEVVSKTLAE